MRQTEDMFMLLICATVIALIAICVVAIVATDHAEQEAHRKCVSRGGSWVVTGHHYQAPTYIQSGRTMIPVGGGDVEDWGCK
jgi:hypothetical protein